MPWDEKVDNDDWEMNSKENKVVKSNYCQMKTYSTLMKKTNIL